MVYLSNLERVTDEKYLIGSIHFQPFDDINGLQKTEEELLRNGALIESLPHMEVIEGKYSTMFYNPIKGTLFYEYEDIPKTEEDIQKEVIDMLGQELAILKIQLMMGGIL